MPLDEKRQRADLVVPNDQGADQLSRLVTRLFSSLKPPRHTNRRGPRTAATPNRNRLRSSRD